jgi:hypothetical protein
MADPSRLVCRHRHPVLGNECATRISHGAAVAAGLAKVPTRAAVTACLVIALVSFVVLGPLHYLWFRALGWVG